MEHAYCICREIIGKTGEFDADGNELYFGDTVAFDKSLAAENCSSSASDIACRTYICSKGA